MATIVKITTETGATRFINLDNVQDVVVSSNQVAVYFSQDDETADILSLGEAAPLLAALEMLAADTDRKIWFEQETKRLEQPASMEPSALEVALANFKPRGAEDGQQ